MSTTIAVTAATGGLGRLVINNLLRRGEDSRLVAIARDAEKASTLPVGVETRIADHDDLAAVAAALEGVDTVLLISGNEFGKRMIQHRNVINAASQVGASRLVYTSAPHASTSTDFITAEHRATEAIIQESGLISTILRMNSYHENYLTTLELAAATGEIVGSVHAGHVASAAKDDYADAAAVVLLAPDPLKAIYELTGTVAWDYPQLAEAAAAVLRRPVKYVDLDSEEHHTRLLASGIDETTAGFLVQLDADLARGVSAEVTNELEQLIGRPPTPLIDGLRAAWESTR
ncbi:MULTISPECIES: NAD(P)H-binding protein [Microbacterium]|uniref:NAD(P)-dependent oxidoreductase n=1 Tax=Microbacterium wangchenii TaxID=2541726 RepID=A0ABX5SRA9_9MICO|nr:MULTISPECIES: NAD(P)H-binding protein [Microbacterium]MCK6065223.1 NAD(P)H-binding protein [Microbacterium sp. EYE_512]QBR88673.1 NAD(P)-dependent oxidoreductase [Microbacterium wangchenii]TFV82276.1 NAD(P)-dependent oxidoreductase [Microbacterium sp. dk485]TXK20397.1 NAD(P)H-binding protein [Microbacterium wangchenii]